MAQRLKRWESPRREGRNDKGRGGSARQRQKRKQFQALRHKLKDQSTQSPGPQSDHSPPDRHQQNHQQGKRHASPLFLAICSPV